MRVGAARCGEGDLISKCRGSIPRCLATLACAAALITSSCIRPDGPPPLVAIEKTISPEPARVGPETINLKLTDATGKPLTGARIAVEADMSHAGMSPVFAEAKEEGTGRYQARVDFPMAGDWVVLLHITLPGGKKLERQIDVKGVRPKASS
jgi:YtkA-like